MKRFNELNCFAELENNILENLNLLKIAKCYCEANFDKSDEIVDLCYLLEIILKKQKAAFNKLVN